VKIRFGTSGWRGIIAREFTWDRVDLLVDAISRWIIGQGRRSVVIGGDTRFLSPELAVSAADRMAGYGFRVFLSDRPVPTPVLSCAVRRLGAGGVVNFTASHNPPLYNGIKFSPSDGGPAGEEVTGAIELLLESAARPAAAVGNVETVDMVTPYLEGLDSILDTGRFEGPGLRVVYDAFSGTGSGVLDRKLMQLGASVRTINGERDPLFAGREHPEPNEKGLAQLSEEVVRSSGSMGAATDGDADRFGLVDSDGSYVSPHEFFPLLLGYLVSERGFRGTAVRSLTTSSLLDRVASRHGIPVVVTPVGFKYLGAVMTERDVVLACEESGGMSVLGHVPEKDGILACLLAAEMVCARGASLGDQLLRMRSEFGTTCNRRLDLKLDEGSRRRVDSLFFAGEPREIAGRTVTGVDRTEGVTLRLEGDAQVIVRLSGTEPLARVYIQAPSPGEVEDLAAGLKRQMGLDGTV
jgi:phosphoglucomutase